MASRAARTASITAGVVVVLVVLVVLLWDWNWFRPLVEARASAALHRRVTIGRLHVRLGRVTQVTLDDVAVDQPAGFDSDARFAVIPQLTVQVGLWDYVFHHHLVLPLIDVERPVVDARQLADGRANWTLDDGKQNGARKPSGGGTIPDIGDLRIVAGTARVRVPKLKADFRLTVATQAPGTGAIAASSSTGSPGQNSAGQNSADERNAGAGGGNPDNQLIVTANGTYAAQKIVGRFIGGALLSLRDTAHPYPVDLHLANGDTTVALTGTVQNPLKFAGADLTLRLAGKDMAALYPLTGVPIPPTPPYHVAGNLDYARNRIRFRDFAGVVGKSDLGGTIEVDPRPDGPRPLVVADLRSRSVDLNDFAGFIGGAPGEKSTPGQSAAQKSQVARAAASDRLLPETAFNVPKLKAADFSLKYRGQHIQGRFMPFDDMVVGLDIKDGDIRLHPLNFAIGRGTLASTISLRSQPGHTLATSANVEFREIDLGRIMQATHAFGGQGTIGGGATIETTGNSLSAMLSRGNGTVRFNMAGGGNLSALLQDISGLQFGDALLSALGVPNRATVRCLRSEFTLKQGVLNTDLLALDTTEAVTRGRGTVDFTSEKLNMQIQTKPVRFSIGTLHAPIDIGGTLKHPAIGPNVGALASRGAAAAGLGVVFPPLALLATIQLGVGNNTACQRLAQGS